MRNPSPASPFRGLPGRLLLSTLAAVALCACRAPVAASPCNQASSTGAGEPALGAWAPPSPPSGPAAAVDPAWVRVAPGDARLQYTGRIGVEGEGRLLSWPASSIRLRFRGRAVKLLLRDMGKDTEQNTNYYNVLLDGRVHQVLRVSPTQGEYALAEGLVDTQEHTLELFKRTEARVGTSVFLGFDVQGEPLAPPAPSARRLEFVGDSITCGYGNELSIPAPPAGDPNTGFRSVNENAYETYGAMVGRELGADVHLTCYSGAGLQRNAPGATNETLPQRYPRLAPDAPQSVYDSAGFTPDAIVVNLGFNDFIQGVPAAEQFEQPYRQFLTQLRGRYPRAHLVAALGPMMNDDYPPGEQHLTRLRTYLLDAVQALRDGGDTRVHCFEHSRAPTVYGEDWHPPISTHRKMADEARAFLSTTLGW